MKSKYKFYASNTQWQCELFSPNMEGQKTAVKYENQMRYHGGREQTETVKYL